MRLYKHSMATFQESQDLTVSDTSFDTSLDTKEIHEIAEDFQAYKFRLQNCGRNWMVFVNLNTHERVALPVPCRDRFCEKCCRNRARRGRILLKALIQERELEERKHSLKFITLTVKNFPQEKLQWGLDAFFKWFSRLRERKIWKENVEGYFYAFEVSVARDGSYHLHLHILAEGSFILQRELAEAWKRIVSKEWQGYIVDIREVKNLRKAYKEISKYVFKPSTLQIEQKYNLSRLLRHRRLQGFGGSWGEIMKGIDYRDLIDSDPLITHILKHWVFEGFLGQSELENWEGWRYDDQKDLWWYIPGGGG